jgi:hypothetical protein
LFPQHIETSPRCLFDGPEGFALPFRHPQYTMPPSRWWFQWDGRKLQKCQE